MNLKTASKQPPLSPKNTLYFSGWGFTERERRTGLWYGGDRVALIRVAGQTFVLRKMNRYVLFRSVEDYDERTALFLAQENYDNGNIHVAYYPTEKFVAELRAKAYGRCVLFVSDIMTFRQCAYMLFHPNGTGTFLEESERELSNEFC